MPEIRHRHNTKLQNAEPGGRKGRNDGFEEKRKERYRKRGDNRGGVTETETEKRRGTNEEQRPNELCKENEVFPKSSLNLAR